jgi:ferrous iron transport protein A
MTLVELAIGSKSKVTDLHLEGAERRRLLDLGLAVGTIIEAVRRSPLGDPTAYRVRGAVIALRMEQACLIEVEPC